MKLFASFTWIHRLFHSPLSHRPACALLALALLTAPVAQAHYCGPPIIRCRPGDVVTYYIISDMAEFGPSFYGVFDQSHPQVAPVVYYTPVALFAGQYVMQALQVGTNDLDLSWAFPPTSAGDICLLRIIVSSDAIPNTAANYPWSVLFGDPVNAFTGELVMREQPDLVLGGPMPLVFARYYASRLQADALVNSRLGNNWSHNFDWRAILGLTNTALIVSPEGLKVRFAKAGSNWALESPTDVPFQLVNSGDDLVFGDPRANRLYSFDTNGLLTAVSDGKGNAHLLTYADGLLSQVTDGLGRTLTFTHIGPRVLSRVSDGTRTVGFAVSPIGSQFNLVRATNALGKVTSYTYDNSKSVGSLLTSTTYPLGNAGYTQVYDSEGRVIRQTRLGTNVTSFAYDTNTFTTYLTNAAGQLSIYAHSAEGRFQSLTDPAGESIAVASNAQGRRARIVDRTGGALGASYDPASGRFASVTNANGDVTRFTYTNRFVSGVTFYELSSVRLPDGSTEQFTYDAVGNLITRRDRASKVTTRNFNSRGQVLSLTNPTDGGRSYTYNADATLATFTDSEAGTASLFYDALRRPTNAVAVDGRSSKVTFDAADRVVSLTDARTNTTRFVYDDNNRLTTVTNAAGQIVQFNYDAADRVTSVLDRLGRRLGYGYDSLDQLVTTTNRNNNRTTLGWDARQRLASVTDPGNQSWSFGYNDESAPTSVTDPLGLVIRHAFDPAGFLSAVTNAAGNATVFNRDALHRVTSTRDPLGRINQFKFDPRGPLTNTFFSAVGGASYQLNDLGLLAQLTDQSGRIWRFNYTPQGRLTSIVDPLDRTNAMAYDAAGRLLRANFPDGSSATNGYDVRGNLTRVDFSGGGAPYTFAFDALNRLTNAANLALAYDAEDRVTNTVSAGLNFGAAYDPGGRVTNVTYNGGALRVTYAYDSRDRLTQVSDNLSGAQVSFFYDDAGRLTNVVRANNVNGTYNYDAAGRVTRIREGTFADLQYALNAAGEIASASVTTPLSAAPEASQTNQFNFDAAHQINSPGYAYDARGRLTTSPGHTFAWNAASQLTRLDNVTNSYNGAGNLLTRANAGSTVRYHYNHAIGLTPIVAEQNAGSGNFLRYYVWTPDGRLLYMIDAANGDAVSYFHFDRVGSTVALTSGAGAVTDAYAYTPFGRLAARTGSNPQPFTYVGRWGVRAESAAGLYQMRARFYDPVSGRFLSRDPFWPRPAEALSLNPYGYAANNPLLFVDPSGARDEYYGEGHVPLEVRLFMMLYIQRMYGPAWAYLAPAQMFAQLGVNPLALMRLGLMQQAMLTYVVLSQTTYGPLFAGRAWMVPGGPFLSPLAMMARSNPFFLQAMLSGSGFYPAALHLYGGSQRGLVMAYQAMASLAMAQVFMPGLVPEMAMVNAHAINLNLLGPNFSKGDYDLADEFDMAPDDVHPQGLAFVNGERVYEKPWDFLEAAEWYDDFYDYLEDEDYWPSDLMEDLVGEALLGPGWRWRLRSPVVEAQ